MEKNSPSPAPQPLCYNARFAIFMLSFALCFYLFTSFLPLKQLETLAFFAACFIYASVKKAFEKCRADYPKERPKLKPFLELPLIALSVILAISIFLLFDPPVKLPPVLLFSTCGALPGSLICFFLSKLLLRFPWCKAPDK